MPISPIFSGYLPVTAPGPFKDIGYTYIRSRPTRPFSIPWPKLKSTGKPALNVEGVGYSLFYPCPASDRGGYVTWFPEEEMVKGYEKFLGKKGINWMLKALKFVVGRLKFPGHLDAPLLPLSEKYPLVLFSHGLAGTRTTYTQYAGALASQGYMVLVMEHRDGSAPAVHLPVEKGETEKRVLYYVNKDDLVWEVDKEKSLQDFRTSQLDLRIREVYEAYQSFKRVVSGDVEGIDMVDVPEEKKAVWLQSVKDCVNVEQVDLTGHSFGAGTALQLIQTPAPEGFDKLPIRKVVALDPWIEPMPVPTATTPSAPASETPPVLVINSPGFTEWSSHFRRLLGDMKRLQGSLCSVIGGNHQSFSDFPLLAPTSPTAALDLLKTINSLSSSFLEGKLLDNPDVKDREPDGGEFQQDGGKMVGGKGEVIVHLIGKQS